jgi:sensor histidine kinase regulating citrate/malate metabolism
VIDYRCSLVDIRLKALDYVMHYSGSLNLKQRMMIIMVLTILSAISLFIVAIFYACIRELRSNIIGKLTLVLAISVANNLIAVETTDGNRKYFGYK